MPDQPCDCGHHWGRHDGDQYGCIECRCNLFDTRDGVAWSGPVLRITESSIDLGVNGRVRGIPFVFHGPTREPLAVTVVAPKAEQEPEPVLVHACTEHRLPLHRHDGGLLYAACTGDAGCWITGHPRCAHHPEEN